ncbi:MAG TPA: NRAMP family divalent metal transporter [Candidatus Aquilonibacter sp.]
MLEQSAHLDEMHVGDIHGAFGSIARSDQAPRRGWLRRLTTFLAILGPGLIVMVGDNDAGAFGTYTAAGQNYGTALLWTMLLLVPVLYVNQEMVLRLGAVSGVGHARLILERFGKFWGAFSVIDLFMLNALTIVTEFIGISLAAKFFGIPTILGVAIAAVTMLVAVSTGSFRRFERFAMVLCFASLLLIPVLITVHMPLQQTVHDFFVPGLPKGDLSTIMLLIIAIVGTTVAPWQLFFQQSYVVDKRITSRFVKYERWDLVVGIVFVLVGAVAMISFTAATFLHHAEFGNFADAGQVATGIAKYVGRLPAALFALALIDASLIGAAAVGLSTAYALGDVLSLRHSLHRPVTSAPQFYAVYGGLMVIAAAIVVIPGSPLGLLTNAVQVLAGVLLPSATVFLLLLSNDAAVLGPWVNGRRTNAFTALVIAALIILSIILTASTLFPSFGTTQIEWTLGIGGAASLLIAMFALLTKPPAARRWLKDEWQMPPLSTLPPARLTMMNRVWLSVLRAYLIVALVLVVVRVVQIALAHGSV